jgi:hypothetical protein
MGELVNIKETFHAPAGMEDVFNVNGSDLFDGVSGGYAIISTRGGKFRVKHDGTEDVMKDADGKRLDDLEVVILKAAAQPSKTYFKGEYQEGDNGAPDCYSIDGHKPDASVENPVHSNCATCPMNAFGSKISQSGSKIKACSDSRRVAVVPLGDITNKAYGGPMLLRIAVMSMKDLARYGKGMAAKGFPYNAIGTRISFDESVSYPKLTFGAIRKLTNEELAQVAEVSRSESLANIFGVNEFAAAAPAPKPAPKKAAAVKEAVSLDFEEEAPAPKPAAKPAAKKAAAKVIEAEVEEVEDSGGNDLDDLLADLDSLG